jgi:uncharacterized membrane protein YgaE (UPF0421/DUF939 family)
MSNEPRTQKRQNPLFLIVASIAATLVVYMALCSFLGKPSSSEDHIFFSVLSAVFGVPIGLAVVMAVVLLKDTRAKWGKANAETVFYTPVNEKDVADLTETFSAKSTEELKFIYAKHHTDEYRAEAYEAVRRLLIARKELKA